MKTYHNEKSTNQKPAKKRTLIGIAASLAVLIIALAIILPLVLRRKSVDGPGPDLPVTADPAKFVSPLEQTEMGMEFNVDQLLYSKTLKRWQTHKGIDLKAEKGTKVRAIADGTVESVSSTNLDGYVVTISHGDGLVSIYKSLGSDIAVEEGDTVKAEDIIGTVDSSMLTEQEEGSHLHLEMTLNGKYVNPMDYISNGGEK